MSAGTRAESITSWEPLSKEASSAFVARRLEELLAEDEQIRNAMPLPKVTEAKVNPGLGLAQVVATCMEGCGDRPALARRAFHVEPDPQTGRLCRKIEERFVTTSYRDLWGNAKALASFWAGQGQASLKADEFLCMIAFGGVDFVTVNLAAIHNGVVVVPMQTNGQPEQLLEIVGEIQPKWVAASVQSLDLAVDLILSRHSPSGLLLFDYCAEVDAERETYERARARLAEAGLPDLITTLEDALEQGRGMPAAPLFAEPGTANRLSSVYYTSGSTGMPKGVMFPEKHVMSNWKINLSLPLLYMHFMPMNHAFGTSGAFMTLGLGGTVYFTAKSDLSLLFEDIKLARPTFIGLVPRVCEMIFQRYKIEFERRAGKEAELGALREAILLELRNGLLGGRFLAANFGSAPLPPDLRAFMEHCLGLRWDDIYGATEMQAATINGQVVRPQVIDYKLEDAPELGYYKTDKPYPRGELLIKTGGIMLGYYKRPEATAAAFDEDGYYRTSDIVAEVARDRLAYVDRRNNIQKLSQGEFVAIAALETLYTNSHSLISQAYLYGTSDRAFLVGVFVPSPEAAAELGITGDDKAIKLALRRAVEEVAKKEKLKAHEVPRDFLVEHDPFTLDNGLLAGIGKYRRPKFREVYGPRLEALYDDIDASRDRDIAALRDEGRNLPVLDVVVRAIQATLGIDGIDLSRRVGFAELGGDSLAALSCSILLEDIFGVEVPAGVIDNPAGSLQQLARYIERARHASSVTPTFTSVHGAGATVIRAGDLKLEKFIDQRTLEAAKTLPEPSDDVRTVLLTGANGYLGRFLCIEWLERMKAVGGKVVSIVRGEDAGAAGRRLAEAFASDRALAARFEALAADHLEVVAGDLGEPRLGLEQAVWDRLARGVDHIVHPAAFVNHMLPYSQLFGPNVVGTAELIRLAISERMKPIDNVSTAAVSMLSDGGVMDEDQDVRTVTPMRELRDAQYASGYANSKWAGEVLLREAHDTFRLPVSIYRCDMILAHSAYNGQVNVPDIFSRWLISTLTTGLAPASFHVPTPGVRPHYDGLPVDYIAAAIAQIGAAQRDGYHTYHVLNPHDDGISMDTFVDWMIDAGHPIRRVPDYEDWFERFQSVLRALPEEQRKQSLLPAIGFLRRPMPAHPGAAAPSPRFQEVVARLGAGGGEVPRISRTFILKNVDDLIHLGLVPVTV